jgi:uncharacterized protein (TIGR03118 family)
MFCRGFLAIPLPILVSLALLLGPATAGTVYEQINLASDIPNLAAVTDPNLKNPWGMSFTATSPFWVSDAGTNVATLYNGLGVPNGLVVSIPASAPTGQVANGTTGFTLTPGNPARFIFAALDGSISGWNPTVNATNAIVKVLASPNNVYTGLALGTAGASTFLYAADFKSAHIDVYDSNFAPTTLAGNFTDPTLPAGFAPFNIENVGGNLYVTYAKVGPTGEDAPGPGNGFVTVFDTSGTFVKRLISNGPLNSPWGITLAPPVFGDFSNDLLVGNFGDGTINAFDPATGALLGTLEDASSDPIVIDGLWALKVRTGGPFVDVNRVYFTAGLNDEENGLFGALAVTGAPAPGPAAGVPEVGTLTMMAIGSLAAAVALRRRRSLRVVEDDAERVALA